MSLNQMSFLKNLAYFLSYSINLVSKKPSFDKFSESTYIKLYVKYVYRKIRLKIKIHPDTTGKQETNIQLFPNNYFCMLNVKLKAFALGFF